jgi:hypothetical protein
MEPMVDVGSLSLSDPFQLALDRPIAFPMVSANPLGLGH